MADPKVKKDDAERRGMNEAEIAAFAAESPTNGVVRAWLSARALETGERWTAD